MSKSQRWIPGSISFSTSDTSNDDEDESTRLLAKNNETIYLDFETNERIDSLTVEINGYALTSTDVTNTDSDGKQWQATFTADRLSPPMLIQSSFQIKSITRHLQATPRTRSHPLLEDDSQKTVRIDVEKPAVKPGSIRFSTSDPDAMMIEDGSSTRAVATRKR